MGLNERTVDLMDLFKHSYVDFRFTGSTSIKKVLLIVCSHLNYDENAIHHGIGAMVAWLEMIDSSNDDEVERIDSELRAYCALDTLAMVKTLRFLRNLYR